MIGPFSIQGLVDNIGAGIILALLPLLWKIMQSKLLNRIRDLSPRHWIVRSDWAAAASLTALLYWLTPFRAILSVRWGWIAPAGTIPFLMIYMWLIRWVGNKSAEQWENRELARHRHRMELESTSQLASEASRRTRVFPTNDTFLPHADVTFENWGQQGKYRCSVTMVSVSANRIRTWSDMGSDTYCPHWVDDGLAVGTEIELGSGGAFHSLRLASTGGVREISMRRATDTGFRQLLSAEWDAESKPAEIELDLRIHRVSPRSGDGGRPKWHGRVLVEGGPDGYIRARVLSGTTDDSRES
jgi:hypothetical protein